jgi:hypothetical protein
MGAARDPLLVPQTFLQALTLVGMAGCKGQGTWPLAPLVLAPQVGPSRSNPPCQSLTRASKGDGPPDRESEDTELIWIPPTPGPSRAARVFSEGLIDAVCSLGISPRLRYDRAVIVRHCNSSQHRSRLVADCIPTIWRIRAVSQSAPFTDESLAPAHPAHASRQPQLILTPQRLSHTYLSPTPSTTTLSICGCHRPRAGEAASQASG